MVRGYHVYKDIWDTGEGETLIHVCVRETSNQNYPYAVAVVKDAVIVRHVPRKISALCSLFRRRGGTLSCRVDGGRWYSLDLPQGGLEISCTLIFTTEE